MRSHTTTISKSSLVITVKNQNHLTPFYECTKTDSKHKKHWETVWPASICDIKQGPSASSVAASILTTPAQWAPGHRGLPGPGAGLQDFTSVISFNHHNSSINSTRQYCFYYPQCWQLKKLRFREISLPGSQSVALLGHDCRSAWAKTPMLLTTTVQCQDRLKSFKYIVHNMGFYLFLKSNIFSVKKN